MGVDNIAVAKSKLIVLPVRESLDSGVFCVVKVWRYYIKKD